MESGGCWIEWGGLGWCGGIGEDLGEVGWGGVGHLNTTVSIWTESANSVLAQCNLSTELVLS